MTLEITNSDSRYLNMAAEEAKKSDILYRHGCVAVSSGKVIARGHNKYRSYSKDGLIRENTTCHAEIDVLRKCIKKNIKNKLTMYVVRLSDSDNFSNSVPCAQCAEIMKSFDVKNICYSCANGNIVKQQLKHFQSNFKTSGQVIYENFNVNPVTIYMKTNI